jgi:hypothetical protein
MKEEQQEGGVWGQARDVVCNVLALEFQLDNPIKSSGKWDAWSGGPGNSLCL